jgi:hypothetical protein
MHGFSNPKFPCQAAEIVVSSLLMVDAGRNRFIDFIYMQQQIAECQCWRYNVGCCSQFSRASMNDECCLFHPFLKNNVSSTIRSVTLDVMCRQKGILQYSYVLQVPVLTNRVRKKTTYFSWNPLYHLRQNHRHLLLLFDLELIKLFWFGSIDTLPFEFVSVAGRYHLSYFSQILCSLDAYAGNQRVRHCNKEGRMRIENQKRQKCIQICRIQYSFVNCSHLLIVQYPSLDKKLLIRSSVHILLLTYRSKQLVILSHRD